MKKRCRQNARGNLLKWASALVVLVFGLATGSASSLGSEWTSGTHSIVVDGMEREFILDLPKELRRDAPLVWIFHGYTGSAAAMRESAGFTELCQQHGFVAIYPQGTRDAKGNAFFNVGYEFHRNQSVDDVSFVRQLTDRLMTDLQLERPAVFATGMSNGGDMSFFLAAQPEPFVCAIAPVAGTMMQSWSEGFVPKQRISILAVHGTEDRVTKWTGDPENRDGWGSYLGVESVLHLWSRGMNLERYRISDVSRASQTAQKTELHHWTTTADDTELTFFKIYGGGHDWPRHLGRTAQPPAAVIWSFFQNHLPTSVKGAPTEKPTRE